MQILAKVESGQHVFAVSLRDLKRRYDMHLQKRLEQGDLAKNTYAAHCYRLSHGIRFLQDTLSEATEKVLDRRISSLDGLVWDGYLAWRFDMAAKKGKTLRRDVCRDELLSIRKMFKFAREDKLCGDKAIPTWSFAVEKEGPKRQRMTPKDYLVFVNCLRKWVKEAKTEREKYNRALVQHFALVVSNSGMRSGELFGLKNKDVQIKQGLKKCIISIRPETSKVRMGRQLTFGSSRGGKVVGGKAINYLVRWMTEYQKNQRPDDYVFSVFETSKHDARDVYYTNYKSLRIKLREIQLEWFDTYHCRHYWVTNRLLDGHSIHVIAKVAGTSVSEIESTYSHVMTEIASEQMNKLRDK